MLLGGYLLFVLSSWLIQPLANFFLLFHKDGKHAIDSTERWTAITVVGSLLTGLAVFIISCMITPGKINEPLLVAAIAFAAMALPLGNIRYPLSFTAYSGRNKIAIVLVGLGLLTVIFSAINLEIAVGIGTIFILLFVINSWVAVFR